MKKYFVGILAGMHDDFCIAGINTGWHAGALSVKTIAQMHAKDIGSNINDVVTYEPTDIHVPGRTFKKMSDADIALFEETVQEVLKEGMQCASGD